jgi:hypothetical protein
LLARSGRPCDTITIEIERVVDLGDRPVALHTFHERDRSEGWRVPG